MNRPVPKIILVLLGIMAAVTVVLSAAPEDWNRTLVFHLGSSLFHRGVLVSGRLYTTVTAIFLHADWFHLIANGIWLVFLGPLIHAGLGNTRFLALFVLCGIAGNVAHAVVNPVLVPVVIGASGAVFGILGAGAYVLTRDAAGGPPKPRNILHYVVVMLILMAGYGLLGIGGNVSWEAHGGGFIAGLVLFPLLRPGRGRTG